MKIELGSIERDSFECGELVRDYFKRTIAGKDTAPLVFKWPVYKALEDGGFYRLFVARDDDHILGFALYAVFEHMHHSKQVYAQCDMIGVMPESRHKGIGRQLITYAEGWFREHGVTHMLHLHRVVYRNTQPLFEKLGFELVELVYRKEL